MTKILITKKNSQFGVRLGQNGAGLTDFIVFRNPDKVWEFLSMSYFDGADVKAELDKQPEISFPFNDGFRIQFDIYTDQYPNETFEELAQKDFAIVLDDGKYSFWSIIAERKGESNPYVLRFYGRRDPWFEQGLLNMINPNIDWNLERGHTLDVKDGLWNNGVDSDNAFPENFEQFQENQFVPKTIEQCSMKYTLQGGTDEERKKFLDVLNNETFLLQVIPVNQTFGDDRRYGFGYKGNNAQIEVDNFLTIDMNKRFKQKGENSFASPYINLIFPSMPIAGGDDGSDPYNNVFNILYLNWDGLPDGNTGDIQRSQRIINAVQSPNVISFKKTLPLWGLDSVFQKVEKGWTMIKSSNNIQVFTSYQATHDSVSLFFAPLWAYCYSLENEFSNKWQLNTATDYNTDVNAGYQENNIAKLHSYPYEKWSLKSVNGTQKFIIQQLVKNNVSISYRYSGAIDSSHIIYKINDKDNQNGIYNTDYKYGKWMDEQENWELPLFNDPYMAYLQSHRESLQMNNKIYDTEKGFALANMIMPNMNGGYTGSENERMTQGRNSNWPANSQWIKGLHTNHLGTGISEGGNLFGTISQSVSNVIGGIKGMIMAEYQIDQQKAMLKDLTNSPHDLKSKGEDIYGVSATTSMSPIMIHEVLISPTKKSTAMYIHQYGVNLGGIPRKPLDYFNHKKYFTFHKGSNTMNSWLVNLPNQQKELFEKSANEGFNVWYYEDWEHWHGVGNYQVNNVDYIPQ